VQVEFNLSGHTFVTDRNPTLRIMPGIAEYQVFVLQRKNAAAVRRMVESMGHERLIRRRMADDMLGIAAGDVSRRLLRRLPPGLNERGTSACFFRRAFRGSGRNGRLRAAATSFRGERAARPLYEEHGPIFRRLNGTFSGVVIDRRERKVVLFNDRFGLADLSA